MYAIYGVPWIPSIYPLYVSIYTSTMDPSWDIRWTLNIKMLQWESSNSLGGRSWVTIQPYSGPGNLGCPEHQSNHVKGFVVLMVLITMGIIKQSTTGFTKSDCFIIPISNSMINPKEVSNLQAIPISNLYQKRYVWKLLVSLGPDQWKIIRKFVTGWCPQSNDSVNRCFRKAVE